MVGFLVCLDELCTHAHLMDDTLDLPYMCVLLHLCAYAALPRTG